MKMKNKNILMSIMLLLPIITGALCMGSATVHADETDFVNITVNKKAYENDDALQNIQNTGVEMPEFSGVKPLPGIGFTPYNVTAEFDAAYKEALGSNVTPNAAQQKEAMEAAQKKLAQTYTNDKLPTSAPVSPEVKTNAEGKATFNVPSKIDGHYQTYMFFETFSPSNVSQKAAPMLTVLPVKYEGNTLTDIQIYPKNMIKHEFNKEMVGHEKESSENGLAVNENGEYNVTIDNGYAQTVGDQIQYYVDFTVPNGIGEVVPFESGTRTLFDQLDISDKMNVIGTTFTSIDKFTVPGENNKDITADLTDHYTLTDVTGPEEVDGKLTQTTPSGFKVKFNLSNKVDDATSKATATALAPYGGETLRIYYTITINEFAIPDVYMQNSATYEFDKSDKSDYHKDESKAPQLIVGGKRFKKIDGSSKVALKDAEFVVQLNKDLKDNQGNVVGKAGQYIQYTDGPADKLYGPGTGNTQAIYDATTAKGVRYVDTKEEASRIVSDENGMFMVRGLLYAEDNAYAMIETKAPDGYAVVNEKTDFTINYGSYGTDEDPLTIEILNNREGLLPGTGGKGIYAFLAVGACIVAVAGVWFVKTKKDETHF